MSQDWEPKKRIAISDAIIEVNDHLKKVLFGRYLLFGLAGLNLLLIALEYFTTDLITPDLLAGIAFLTVLFVIPFLAFGAFYPKKPLLFLILGLLLYLSGLLLTAYILGVSLFQGYAWKVAILSAFGFSWYSISQWNANLMKLRELGYPGSVIAEARRKLKPIARLKKRKVKS